MRYCIVITRRGNLRPIVLGPFRDERRATRKAEAIANALKARGHYLAVDVEDLHVGATPAGEIADLVQ